MGFFASSESTLRPRTQVILLHGSCVLARYQALSKLLHSFRPFTPKKLAVLASAEILLAVPESQQHEVLGFDQHQQRDGVHWARLAPGCMCCTSSLVMQTHLSRLVRLNPPEYLLIELDSTVHVRATQGVLTQGPWEGKFASVLLQNADD